MVPVKLISEGRSYEKADGIVQCSPREILWWEEHLVSWDIKYVRILQLPNLVKYVTSFNWCWHLVWLNKKGQEGRIFYTITEYSTSRNFLVGSILLAVSRFKNCKLFSVWQSLLDCKRWDGGVTGGTHWVYIRLHISRGKLHQNLDI